MKFKSEKGVTGIDAVIALIIFIVGSAAVLFIYLNIYKTIALIKINEEVISYVTQVLEEVDKEDYDNVTEERMNAIIVNSNVPDTMQVSCTITKYIDQVSENRQETGVTGDEIEDLVKRVSLNIKYTAIGVDRNYTISRVKVREL